MPLLMSETILLTRALHELALDILLARDLRDRACEKHREHARAHDEEGSKDSVEKVHFCGLEFRVISLRQDELEAYNHKKDHYDGKCDHHHYIQYGRDEL